ncbi:hypothetical protein [Photorhabdus namnaonensis]|uniref:Uncharacterized protein n=1 Tax=Photorhabdus namnaonensis TaxID=1851568 RepID=A0A1B8YGN7_9GAMM|nr:hypothetical protein [Photorhabdus namnaonensis]OCA54290.1 hypothetical protein Phpb_02734 [Photorhabdus namnaonensis]
MPNSKYNEKVNHSGNRTEKPSIYSKKHNTINNCSLELGLDLQLNKKLRTGNERDI